MQFPLTKEHTDSLRRVLENVYLNIARCDMRMKHYRDVIAIAEKAAESESKGHLCSFDIRAKSRFLVGKAYLLLERPKEAVENLRAALTALEAMCDDPSRASYGLPSAAADLPLPEVQATADGKIKIKTTSAHPHPPLPLQPQSTPLCSADEVAARIMSMPSPASSSSSSCAVDEHSFHHRGEDDDGDDDAVSRHAVNAAADEAARRRETKVQTMREEVCRLLRTAEHALSVSHRSTDSLWRGRVHLGAIADASSSSSLSLLGTPQKMTITWLIIAIVLLLFVFTLCYWNFSVAVSSPIVN